MPAGTPGPIGVIGGSGFYSFFEAAETVTLSTPWGAPSSPVTVGSVGGVAVAFVPRHGRHHEHLPHEVPARANLWALHALGVQRVLAPCSVGSLRADFRPGDFVVLDQIVDRTWGRPSTFFDRSINVDPSGAAVFHLPFADPYCPDLRARAVTAGHAHAGNVHDRGTVVVIPGPRFSTRAESRWYRAQGWDVVNMTQAPEAVLAAELGMCYCGIALVTDYDSGLDDDPTIEPVTMEQVMATFEANIERVRDLLLTLIPNISPESACSCAARRGPLETLPSD